jgi:hypothetical protein
MSSRYIGLTAAACGAAGAVLSVARLRTFAQIPRLFIKADQGGTVPVTEPGNVRTAIVVALLWGADKCVARLLKLASLGSLPSSLVSLLLTYAGLSTIAATAGTAVSDKICAFFKPGVDFLVRKTRLLGCIVLEKRLFTKTGPGDTLE